MNWSATFIRLGLLLLGLGLIPLALYALILRGADPLIPGMLALSAAPLGALALVIGILIWIIQKLTRR